MRTGYIAGVVVALVVFGATYFLQDAPKNITSTASTITINLEDVSTVAESAQLADLLATASATVQTWVADPSVVKAAVESNRFPSISKEQAEYFTIVATPLSASFTVEHASTDATLNEKELTKLAAVLQDMANKQEGANPKFVISATAPTSGDQATALPINVVASAGVGILLGVLAAALTERASAKKAA
jgi:hypothetical protein